MASVDIYWHWLREGWKYRLPHNKFMQERKDEYAARVKYESELVVAKDFVDYFLMLSDVVRAAKDAGIPVGPARGSAAASLVCYLLRITEVDPLQFPTMVFERFLDASRTDLPDVDLDFADDRREEIREHLVRRYGADRVGNIANVVRYLGKTALNDVARVYKLPFNDIETIKGLVIERSGGDSRFDSSLADTIEMFPAAKAAYGRHPELAYALELEGNVRSMNVHAAGLVVSNEPISKTCALITKKVNGHPRTVVAYDKKDAEYLGMLKADFLSLSTLGAIGHTLDMIGMSLADLYRVPLDEPETIAAFRKGDVVGIFQFEGRATRMVNNQVQPEHFMHLADINALSRPGPLFSGMAEAYIEVKNGRRERESLHPIVDKATDFTYGQIVYQEQVLTIIRELGGFPVTKIADIRKIISQKLGEASFNAMLQEFLSGAERLHGVDTDLAMRIWKFMVTSATYSFNIAHCVSYSMLAFWQMWLKVHYPVEFYAGAMRKVGDDKKAQDWKRPRMLRDAQRHGVPILAPALGLSEETWTSADGKLVAGYRQIPKVGEKTAMLIHESVKADPKRYQTWGDLTDIRGIGDKTVADMREFALKPDPFDLELTGRILGELRTELRGRNGAFRHIPKPTHTSDDLPREGDHWVTWIGIVKNRQYKDWLEDERAKSGRDVKEILADMDRPDLLKSCVLQCYDDGEEEVYVRFSRWAYPKFKDQLEAIVEGQNIVIASGKKRQGFGLSIQCNKLFTVSIGDTEDEE